MAVAWGQRRSKKRGKDGSNPLEGLRDHLGAPTDGTDLTDWLDPAEPRVTPGPEAGPSGGGKEVKRVPIAPALWGSALGRGWQRSTPDTALLRQEIDGPQAEQLEFVPCGQILQDEEDEELSPAQRRHHMFLILKVKETFPTTHAQKASLEVKKGVMSAYPEASSQESTLAERCTRTHGRTLR